MKDCPQTDRQSTLQHGFSVKNYTNDLVSHLRYNTPLKYKWVLPNWLTDNKSFILESLVSDNDLKLYTIFHDCGKWDCITTDDSGKRHFPNHAEMSYKIFNQYFDNETVADLIFHDMDIHLLKSNYIDSFTNTNNPITLLFVGLCELHSNAEQFGIESTSFKIKWKSINQRGKQILQSIKIKNKK